MGGFLDSTTQRFERGLLLSFIGGLILHVALIRRNHQPADFVGAHAGPKSKLRQHRVALGVALRHARRGGDPIGGTQGISVMACHFSASSCASVQGLVVPSTKASAAACAFISPS